MDCVILQMLQKNHIYGYPCRCLGLTFHERGLQGGKYMEEKNQKMEEKT